MKKPTIVFAVDRYGEPQVAISDPSILKMVDIHVFDMQPNSGQSVLGTWEIAECLQQPLTRKSGQIKLRRRLSAQMIERLTGWRSKSGV